MQAGQDQVLVVGGFLFTKWSSIEIKYGPFTLNYIQPPPPALLHRLDKTKFFVVGGFLFTGLTTALFPLTVIKTRQMALEGAPRGVKVRVGRG